MAQQSSGTPIQYHKIFTEKVTISLSAPEEPADTATGGELLHGYLVDIHRLRDRDEQLKNVIDMLCRKWNVTYM